MQLKADIIARASQFKIMAIAFEMLNINITEEYLVDIYEKRLSFKSPFRPDKGPSLGLHPYADGYEDNLAWGLDQKRICIRDFGVNKDYGPRSPYVFCDCFGLVCKALTYFPELLKNYYIFPSATLPQDTTLDIRKQVPKPIRSQSFMVVLRHIDEYISGLGKGGGVPLLFATPIIAYKRRVAREPNFGIDIQPRAWNVLDVNYWKQFSIDTNDLQRNNVVPVQVLYRRDFVTGNVSAKYSYNIEDPCYAYILDFVLVNDNIEWLIEAYFPKRNRDVHRLRFYTNCPNPIPFLSKYWFKVGYVYPADVLIINKSRKESLAMTAKDPNGKYKFIKQFELGPHSIDKPTACIVHAKNEGIVVGEEELLLIKGNYKLVVVLFDPDRAGYSGMFRVRKSIRYVTHCIAITTVKQNGKDWTDYLAKNGRAAGELLASNFEAKIIEVLELINRKGLKRTLTWNSVF